MDIETIRLSLGAFLTSPGAGVLGLIGAALLTYVGVDKRLRAERRLALDARAATRAQDSENDARERWQLLFTFLWDNQEDLGATSVLHGLGVLRELATTSQQLGMLEVLTLAVLEDAEEELAR
ncbi:hypothetical protein BCF74_10972 [Knoellia remsis]|uniref:Uncharacterized protein n=1 Tax=Knoellia remsis TaxID=407159 RepID=A0A2T0UNI4_9MICO|nr:hypothetical protein [Knoellia remsis]PRY59482.1 hypothetical protein BCF74_10972 [Knoellia remsis]